jgi:hypothetical protein
MKRFLSLTFTLGAALLSNATFSPPRAAAEVHEIDLTGPLPAQNLEKFTLGTAKNPAGVEIAADGVSLLEDGKRITPAIGEFHYSRYPRKEWRDELLKMKAGGIGVVSTYVFWIHHEETEGQWDFSGDRDLRAFVQLCGEVGLKCIVRCGPWCHGEVRNGGFPDWLIDKKLKLRSTDPAFLHEVQPLYAAIADQLKGLAWKDGGPLIGIQIENECGDPNYLLKLKQMAVDAGIDVPLYTRTGWPDLKSPIQFGQLLPLYGGYAEGFWDRSLESMPGRYWKEFVFKKVRTDTAIASEHFGSREAQDEPNAARYPYLTCEIGPGMMTSYHRRITVFPEDVQSMVVVKLGSGSNSPGYYMYHGGTNPTGKEPWLQENQLTHYTNYNDLPVKSYDFQTALGEFGQVRPQYRLLKMIHMFLNDFGDQLAPLSVVLPEGEVSQKSDTKTFRWSVRTDGHKGFVFINNYQRLLPQPSRPGTQFKLKLKDGELEFPEAPVTIAADTATFWPFNLDLGDDITLVYATAQPLCRVRDGNTVYTLFAPTGLGAEFAFDGQASAIGFGGRQSGERFVVRPISVGNKPVATLVAKNSVKHEIILLDNAVAKNCYKGKFAGQDRVVVSPGNVMFDGDSLRITKYNSTSNAQQMGLLPAPKELRREDQLFNGTDDGVFTNYRLPSASSTPVKATIEKIKDAGPPRTIAVGKAKVAMEPTDADFDQAAVWKIKLPAGIDPARKLLLRIHYNGDVARAYLGDTFLTDNFFNGAPFEIALNRFGPKAYSDGITLKILPLQADAPIFILDGIRPNFYNGEKSLVDLQSVDVIETRELKVTGK